LPVLSEPGRFPLHVQVAWRVVACPVSPEAASFSVGEGTVTAFLGPNGAGKTTTLRMLLGLVKPSAGSAAVTGRPYREVRSSVGASLEAVGFHPGRIGRGHLRARALAPGTGGSRIEDLLAMVDLAGSAGSRIGTYLPRHAAAAWPRRGDDRRSPRAHPR
jgi:ABC-type Na+ transport system ATPase subunit NatA